MADGAEQELTDDGAGGRSGLRWQRTVLQPVAWVVGAWVVLNGWWLWVNRRSRVFELDEAGYASVAARFSRQRTWSRIWGVLHEGNHGPMQAILAAPPQWLRGSDPATLLWENLLFAAGAAVAVHIMTTRLANRSAGAVAATLVLLSPGLIEHSRTAMTVMPSVLFASVAMAAVVLGRGLERGRWAAMAGVAVGCMTLSRSMTIAFAPVVGVAALGWAISLRTPLRVVVRNGALAAVAGLVTASWWFVLRWADVSEWLFEGGGADTVQQQDYFYKVSVHVNDVQKFIGYTTFAIGVFVYLVLRLLGRVPAVRRRTAPVAGVGPGASEVAVGGEDPDRPLALWPLAAASASGIAVLSTATAFGIGFSMPLVPWVVTAAVAFAWRTLARTLWWIWAVTVTLVAAVVVVPAAASTRSGLASEIVWCGPDKSRSSCEVDTVAEGWAWKEAIADVGDGIWRARSAGPDGSEFRVALLSRDQLLNSNTLGLELELRHSIGIDMNQFFLPSATKEDQLAAMVEGADLLVVADDLRPDVILGTYQPDPRATRQAARDAGFVPCGEVQLPDGRTVSLHAAPDAPTGTCAA